MALDEKPDFTKLIHKRDIKERSDFDRDQKIDKEELGEDWGDGFHVETEPVLVERGADGEIVRTTPLSELELRKEFEAEQADKVAPIEVDPVVSPRPLNAVQREKLVRILAVRLFKEYAARPPEDPRYNPIYHGLPDVPPGSPQNLQPIPGTKMYPATHGQILEWLKTNVIGARAQWIDRKMGNEGYKPSLSFKRSM